MVGRTWQSWICKEWPPYPWSKSPRPTSWGFADIFAEVKKFKAEFYENEHESTR
jgi:hypothetical protein